MRVVFEFIDAADQSKYADYMERSGDFKGKKAERNGLQLAGEVGLNILYIFYSPNFMSSIPMTEDPFPVPFNHIPNDDNKNRQRKCGAKAICCCGDDDVKEGKRVAKE